MDTKIKCIAVDDERQALNIVEAFCKRMPALELVGACQDVFEAVELIKTEDVQLMFLDLNMQPVDGITFLRLLPEPPMTIIITGFPEFLVDTEDYNLNPIDVLLKPYSFERFEMAVQRALNAYQKEQQDLKRSDREGNNYTYFKTGKQFVKVDYEDIYYLEAMDYLVKIHTMNGVILTAPKINLSYIEQHQLVPLLGADSSFLRIHRSYIVNLDMVVKLLDNKGSVEMSNGSVLSIGRTYRDRLLERLGI
jgi:DNA-binding LytR/AlgR family response regulator